ncbi:TPA: putative Ig domain-containing protein [Staphylococcus delphini]|nr:putative Ig domain-containing protein [Staphylococcus delphini]HEC2191173.1 putative Ig domain-containing protein [Staphylococcus delphini]HEC2198349.1 putative Ig domain-containing protein [Staphylococcus delphini]HEC2203469.1 putative Ig domain-containing protein [Staphylococcus delphini]HEC2205939.1 putative Ig domain-containing protein [Staphylococcus delphini]
MSKKENALNQSLKQEVSRTKLYKSGKHWVTTGIREMKLLGIMGASSLTKRFNEVVDEDESKRRVLKKSAIKISTLAGGALTVNAFQGHEAMAMSEALLSSQLAKQSETVANQNSTELKRLSESETSQSESIQSSEQSSTQSRNTTSESERMAESTNEPVKGNTQSSELLTVDQTHSGKSERQLASQETSTVKNEVGKNNDTSLNVNTTEHTKATPDTVEQNANRQDSGDVTTNGNITNTSRETNEASIFSSAKQSPSTMEEKVGQSTSIRELTSNQSQKLYSKGIESLTAYNIEATSMATTGSASTKSTAMDSNLVAPTTKVRAFSRLAVNNLTATPTAATVTPNQAVVNKDNFTDYFTTSGAALYNPYTGVVTLTPDANSQKGAITLGTKIDSNKSFHFIGKVNLGTRYEGYSPDGVTGGDGIGFAFSPGTLGQIGKEGAALGIGGLNNAFGFKLDTFHNTSKPNASASANADPSNVAGGGAFGAFVTTNSTGVASTYTDNTTTANAAKLKTQPNGTFQDFVIDYNGDTKVMTIDYAGQRWTRNIADWIKASGNTNFSLSMTASTGGARNLQQVQIGSFTYTESAVTQVHYVDQDTGKEIIPSKKLAGDVGNVLTVDNQQSTITAKGYQFVNVDATSAPTYDSTNSTVRLTNAGQSITVFYKDVKAPTLNMATQTKELNSAITPIQVNTTDNGTGTVTNTVSNLPPGLSYDAATKTITGTPTSTGSYTVTIKSVDQAGNTASSTFTFNVVDTTQPVVTIDNQSNQVFTPINDVKIQTSDNSGATTETVTGLPPGLTYHPETKTVSGTPTQLGSYVVTVTSKDASNNTTSKIFIWNITRNIASDSISDSQSTSMINSIKTSTSIFESRRASVSTSASVSGSMSASTLTSVSLSDSSSAVASESVSTSNSVYTSDSLSTSIKDSASVSTSESIVISNSISTSLQNSVSESTSLSTSLSDSRSVSGSTSLSVSDSNSLSVINSTSKSDSISVSLSTSASLSEGESTSLNDSELASVSKSMSMSESTSLSNSTSYRLSESDSTSASESTSMYVSASESNSESLSLSMSLYSIYENDFT